MVFLGVMVRGNKITPFLSLMKILRLTKYKPKLSNSVYLQL